jgi:hypothetical protein
MNNPESDLQELSALLNERRLLDTEMDRMSTIYITISGHVSPSTLSTIHQAIISLDAEISAIDDRLEIRRWVDYRGW